MSRGNISVGRDSLGNCLATDIDGSVYCSSSYCLDLRNNKSQCKYLNNSDANLIGKENITTKCLSAINFGN